MRVPWTTRRSNQSTLKEINPEVFHQVFDKSQDATNHPVAQTKQLQSTFDSSLCIFNNYQVLLLLFQILSWVYIPSLTYTQPLHTPGQLLTCSIVRSTLLGPSLHCGLPWWLSSKESTCNAGDTGLVPGSRSPLEKEMATHSSILAWKIPWTVEPGGLKSMGLQKSWTQLRD